MANSAEELRKEFERKGILPMGYFVPQPAAPPKPVEEEKIKPVEFERPSRPWLSTQRTPPIKQIEDYRKGLEKQREKWRRVWDIYYGTVAGKKEEELYNLLVKKYEAVGLDEKDLKRAELLPPNLKQKILELAGKGEE